MQIQANQSQLLLIDMQARLLPHITDHAAVSGQCVRMLRAAAALDLPTTALEQYRQGLGETPEEIRAAAGGATWFEKTTFSGCGDERIAGHVDGLGRPQVLLIGIEAHVCVLKTALDLLDRKLCPIVVADAVGSRRPLDRDLALDRMRQAGVIVTSAESAIFEWLDDCRSPEFKRILPLVK